MFKRITKNKNEFFLDTNLNKNLFKYFSELFKHIQIHNMHTKLTQQIIIQCVWYKIGAKIIFDGTLRLPDKQ